jgi:hypothetical protein
VPGLEEMYSPYKTFVDRLRGRSRLFWFVIVVILVLNVWFDYYHRLGILLDVILLLGLLVGYVNARRRDGH